jgi:protein-tyrosine phosphatase
MRSILFVCTANICRSPTAAGVMRRNLARQGAGVRIEIESAGTHDYHVGKPPFPTAVEVARQRGYDLTQHIARRISSGDFDHYDMILAMDRGNIASLRQVAPTRAKDKIELLLEYGDEYHGEDVPDPYGGEVRDFEVALRMIEDGCSGLLKLLPRS